MLHQTLLWSVSIIPVKECCILIIVLFSGWW